VQRLVRKAFLGIVLLPVFSFADNSETVLKKADRSTVITAQTGIAMGEKNGYSFIATNNGRFVIKGDYSLLDTVNNKRLKSIDDVEKNDKFFNFLNSPIMYAEKYVKIGNGSKKMLVIADVKPSFKDIKALHTTMKQKGDDLTVYLLPVPSPGAGMQSMNTMYNAHYACNPGKFFEGFSEKNILTTKPCKEGIAIVGMSHFFSHLYELGIKDKDLPLFIDSSGKLHRNVNSLTSIINIQ
jgi:hypothetical protein